MTPEGLARPAMPLTAESEALLTLATRDAPTYGFGYELQGAEVWLRERLAAIEAAARKSAETERDRLVALSRYARHAEGCSGEWDRGPCSCGYRAARAALAPPDTAVERAGEGPHRRSPEQDYDPTPCCMRCFMPWPCPAAVLHG